MSAREHHWGVTVLSAAGVIFILLGLLALALPTSQEGTQLWEFDSRHAIYLMDVAGSVVLALGLALTWIGGRLWNRHLLS